ncbi:uncharacterized protein METZ01_LOCUS164969, partial [marine metagenome]
MAIMILFTIVVFSMVQPVFAQESAETRGSE